ncbi:MAG: hypothetical protein J6T54_06500 [Fibrobacter sp.]|nr:hypothetical protein [Fibrobacter sp.]
MIDSGKIKITNDGKIIMQFSNYHHVIDSDTELCYKHQVDKVIAELKEAQRWRKFSEEKPEHHQRILVCSRDYKTELRRWDEGCKFDVETQEIYTHWMPLPKEPEDFT